MTWDVAESYRDGDTDEKDWLTVRKTVEDYTTFNWHPTCWTITAMYEHGPLEYGYDEYMN
ncbi:MAG TPA: hypothetical protein VK978_03975 [Candidatus Saccharimonadales bacterium]|nr:hypothetical protein [Candidatus Saccharimonadales bacterium]